MLRSLLDSWDSSATCACIVNVVGGLLVGYSIGYVPVALELHSQFSECSAFPADGCPDVICKTHFTEAINGTACRFIGTGGGVATYCPSFQGKSACSPHTDCYWKQSAGECRNAPEWDDVRTGIFAAMMIVGGMIGSPAATPLLNRLGRKKSLLATSVVAIIASVLLTVGWAVRDGVSLANFPMMVTGRFFIGVAVGLASVVCPMYCGEMAPETLQGVIGVMFQIFVTIGIFLAALVGFLVHATTTRSGDVSHRFQIVNALAVFFSVALVPVSIGVRESERFQTPSEAVTTNDEQDPLKDAAEPVAWRNLVAPGLTAITLAAGQQLTGINAIMNFAPEIMAAADLKPLQGNLLVMTWNCITTFASIPLAKRFSSRQMYICSAFIASLACLLTGIPTFPQVSAKNATSDALAGIGIFVFVAAFEFGMGPTFYVLSQAIFPASLRSVGCSATVMIQFVFNLIINLCYPIARTGLSGGKNQDQRLGMAVIFIFFGAVGLMCVAILMFRLKPPVQDDDDRDDAVDYNYD